MKPLYSTDIKTENRSNLWHSPKLWNEDKFFHNKEHGLSLEYSRTFAK